MQNIIKQYEQLTKYQIKIQENSERFGVLKDGKKIKTVSLKDMESYIKTRSNPTSTVKKVSGKECLLSRLIFKSKPITASDTKGKVISTKLRTADAIKLEQIALDNDVTPSELLRGYVEELIKSTK